MEEIMRISWFAFLTDKIIALAIVGAGLYLCWKYRHSFKIRLLWIYFAAFLALFFLMRLILLYSFYSVFSSLNGRELAFAFLQGIQFDLCAAAMLAGVFMIAVLLPVKQKIYYQVCSGLCALLWIVTAGFCAGDLVYFSFVKRHTGSEILLAVYDVDLLMSLASSQYLWAIILLLLVAVGVIIVAVRKTGKWYAVPARPTLKTILCGLLCVLMIFFAFRGRLGFRFKPLTIQEAYTDGNIARGNLALNGAFCIYKSISKKYAPVSKLVGSEEALQRARHLLGSSQEKFVSDTYPLLRQRHTFNVNKTGLNIVIIVIESWQYKYTDGLSEKQYGATPVLEDLVKRSLVFDNFYASGQRSINGNGTIMSGVAQLQGLPYFSMGLEGYHFKGLADLLRKAGYRTIFTQPADWNSAQVGMVARLTGFEEIYALPDMQSLGDYVRPGIISDYDGLMLLADKLNGESKPFFALFFTAAMHPPFYPLHKNFQRFAWDQEDKGYLNTLSYTDWAIGEFLAKLKQQGQYDNTVFILVADHTLGWGESGSFEDCFHIPLLLHAPTMWKGQRLTRVGSQVDLLPTVLDIAQITEPYAAMGNSLLDEQAEHFAFTSQDGRILGWKHNDAFLEHTGTAVVKSDNNQPANPEEERNLLGLNRAVYDALRAQRWAGNTEQ